MQSMQALNAHQPLDAGVLRNDWFTRTHPSASLRLARPHCLLAWRLPLRPVAGLQRPSHHLAAVKGLPAHAAHALRLQLPLVDLASGLRHPWRCAFAVSKFVARIPANGLTVEPWNSGRNISPKTFNAWKTEIFRRNSNVDLRFFENFCRGRNISAGKTNVDFSLTCTVLNRG